jgi:hypothetical protein
MVHYWRRPMTRRAEAMTDAGPTPREIIQALRLIADQMARYTNQNDGLRWPPSFVFAEDVGSICRHAAETIERLAEADRGAMDRRQGVLL